MAKLPMIIKPEKDELLYSYLRRLALTMDETDWEDFSRRYIRPFDSEKTKVRAIIRYDSNTDLSYIIPQIGLELGLFPSDILLKMTIYPAFAPLLTEYQQTDWINQISRENSLSMSLTTRVHSDMITELRICPQCYTESQRLIYYRKHQLPGVKVCAIHGCSLHRYIGPKGEEFNYHQFEMITESISVTDIEYARFVLEFLENPIEADNNTITAAIKKKFGLIGFKQYEYKKLIRYATRMNRQSVLTEEVLMMADLVYKKSGDFKRRLNPEMLLKLLFALFLDTDEIRHAISTRHKNKEKFTAYIADKGYRLISPYNELAVTLRHAECGYEFITKPDMFMAGWECPQCDLKLSEQSLFARLIKNIYGEEYEQLTPFRSAGDPVSIKHLTCGKILTRRAVRFYHEKTMCGCQKDVNTQSNASKLMKRFPDWKLIHFEGMREEVRLLHKPCGTEKSFCNMYNFLRLPNCPVCNPISTSQSDFLKSLQSVAGDRITMLGKYEGTHKKIDFRCNKCGEIFKSEPIHLLRGRRCPRCSETIRFSYDEMAEYLRDYTDGRYIITNQPYPGRFVVKDIYTGTEQSMTRQMILQELTRPTPSELLPMDKSLSNTRETIEKSVSIISNWCEVFFQNHDWFYYLEIKKALTEDLKLLSKKEFLLGWVEYLPLRHIRCIQQTWRLYVPYGKDIDTDRFIEERFMYDSSGNRIGFFTGAHFLRELGIQVPLSSRPQVITNYPIDGKDTTLTIDNIRYCIDGARHGPITDENYRYQQVLSWIQSSYYSKKPDVIEPIKKFIINNQMTLDRFEKELFSYSSGAQYRIKELFSQM